MHQVCVGIPDLREARTVDLEVTVGGRTHFVNYRVESLDWSGVDDSARIDRLRAFVRNYDKHWELVSIGSPSNSIVPITFRRQRREQER